MNPYTAKQPNTIFLSSPPPGLLAPSTIPSNNAGITNPDSASSSSFIHGENTVRPQQLSQASTVSSSPPLSYRSVLVRDDPSKAHEYTNSHNGTAVSSSSSSTNNPLSHPHPLPVSSSSSTSSSLTVTSSLTSSTIPTVYATVPSTGTESSHYSTPPPNYNSVPVYVPVHYYPVHSSPSSSTYPHPPPLPPSSSNLTSTATNASPVYYTTNSSSYTHSQSSLSISSVPSLPSLSSAVSSESSNRIPSDSKGDTNNNTSNTTISNTTNSSPNLLPFLDPVYATAYYTYLSSSSLSTEQPSSPFPPLLMPNMVNGWVLDNNPMNPTFTTMGNDNHLYSHPYPIHKPYPSARFSNNSLPSYNYPRNNNHNSHHHPRVRYTAPLPPPPYQAHHTVRAAYQQRQKQLKQQEVESNPTLRTEITNTVGKTDIRMESTTVAESNNLSNALPSVSTDMDNITPLSNQTRSTLTEGSDITIDEEKLSNEASDNASPVTASPSSSYMASRLPLNIDVEMVETGKDLRTTLMIRNVPNKYTQNMLVNELNATGFNSLYDFVYLPIDVRNGANVGYGFINITEPKDVATIVKVWCGRNWNQFNSKKRCDVTYARIQGRTALISRFQVSPVVYHFPDTCQPLLFISSGPDKGKPEPFPLLAHLPSKGAGNSNDTSIDGGNRGSYHHRTYADNSNDRMVMMSALGFGFDGGYRGSATSTANPNPSYRGHHSHYSHRGNYARNHTDRNHAYSSKTVTNTIASEVAVSSTNNPTDTTVETHNHPTS